MYYPYILKELKRRSGRTLVNISGIAIGIALFVSINAISTAYKNAAAQPFKDIGTDLIVQRSEKNQSQLKMTGQSMRGIRLPFSNQLFRQQDMDVLKQFDGIAAEAHALLLWEFSHNGFRTIMGTDAGQSSVGAGKVREWVKTGRFSEESDEIAIEAHFAKFNKLETGNTLRIGGKPFTIVGLIEIKEGTQVAAANVYMPLDSAQDLLGEGSEALNLIYLRLQNPSMLTDIKAMLSKRIKGATISSTDSFLEIMGGVSKISEKFALIASIVGLLGAVGLIMKTLSSNVVERTHEIGILKAVGWTQQDVQRQLRIEALIQAIAGGILGLFAGYIISILLGFLAITIPIPWELNPVPAMAKQIQGDSQVVRFPISVSLSLAVTALGISIGTGIVTAYFICRRAAGMKPADSLRKL